MFSTSEFQSLCFSGRKVDHRASAEHIYIWWSAVWVGPCDYLVTLPIGGHKVPGHKVPGHKVMVSRFFVGASLGMSKSVVKACSTYEKTRYYASDGCF